MRTRIRAHFPYYIIAFAGILLLIRCLFSFCWSDETFYFSTAYRFYQGDSIFQHDWFPTQLSSIMLLPLFSLFVTITGSTTGVILFFRICFVIFALILSIVIYRIIRHSHPQWIAVICSLFYLFYTHLNIATLSYYTMSVGFFLVSMLLLYHYYHTERRRNLIFGGILFALSVLALPTMAVAYILVIIGIAVLLLLCRFLPLPVWFKHAVTQAHLVIVCWYTFLGILIPASVFAVFMLLNVKLQDFIQAIPYVLTDEEHITSFIYPLKKFFIGINEVYGYAAYLGYLLIVITMLLALAEIHIHLIPKALKIILCLVDLCLFAIYFSCSIGHTGYIQTALCMFALPLFFLTRERSRRAFFLLFVPGMIFSIVYSYSSNGYLYILSMGHFIASIGGIMMIYDFKHELCNEDTDSAPLEILSLLCTCVLLIALLQTVTLRFVNVYRDAPLSELTVKLEDGPASGLYTTPEQAKKYQDVYNVLTNECQLANLNPDKNNTGSLFITKLLPFGYMCSDLKCGSPTTWRTQFNSTRLEDYYKLNPDRYPDLILVVDEDYGSYETCGDVVADPRPNENEIGGYLLDYVMKEGYEEIPVACGTLYKR